MNTSHKRIAFFGLGEMGGAMAYNMLKAGHLVRGFDIKPAALAQLHQRGGFAASTPAIAALDADIAVLMVHDMAQVQHVLFGQHGAAAALPQGAVVWVASTVTADDARSLEERLASLGLLMLDGPVSGGATGAEAGDLSVIAGGSDLALAAAQAAIKACASAVFHVGELGAGSTVKMINNLLAASHIALTAEALAFGVRAGVNAHKLIEVIRQSSGNSRMFEKRAPRMLAGNHAPQATVKIFLKDLGIALDAARDLGFPTPLAATAHQMFTMAAGMGYAADSDTRLLDVYERLGSVDVAAWVGCATDATQ